MAEKNIKTRIIHKHDTETNWNKATTFIPKAAELIIYDPDTTHLYPRAKVGDGKTVVSNLPFISIAESELTALLNKKAKSTAGDGVADSAVKLSTSKTIDGVSFNGESNITHFGVCSSSANDGTKVVDIAGFVLATGARVVVKFTTTNVASGPKLNVNSTGAKSILYRGTTIPTAQLAANRIYEFVYDGTYYNLIGDTDTVYTHPNSGVTAGTYNNVTVDAHGHITAASNTSCIDDNSTSTTKTWSGSKINDEISKMQTSINNTAIQISETKPSFACTWFKVTSEETV